MNFKHFIIIATLAALGVPFSAMAQGAAENPTAPRTVIGGQPFDVPIQVSGSGAIPEGEDVYLRLPQPAADLEQWITTVPGLVAAHQAAPTAWSWGRLQLKISASGSVSGCAASDRSTFPLEQGQMCEIMSAVPFIPALAKSGEPVAGSYSFSISRSTIRASEGSAPLPLVNNSQRMVPAPPPARPLLRPDIFPPTSQWMRTYYEEPEWKIPPLGHWQDGVIGSSITGLIVTMDGAQPGCLIMESSSQTSAAGSACAYAQNKLAPSWPSVNMRGQRGVPLYIHENPDGTMVAIGPAENRQMITTMPEETEQQLVADLNTAGIFPRGRELSDLRLFLRAAPDGSLEHCRVAKTTGSDAGDIDACNIAYRVVRLSVAQDIFGRPAQYRSLFWNARPNAE